MEFGCCAVTSAALDSRDSLSARSRGTAAATDGATNQGCCKHSYSTMYSSLNPPPRPLSDPRKSNERIYDYYSKLFYYKGKISQPQTKFVSKMVGFIGTTIWLNCILPHWAVLFSIFFSPLFFLKVAGMNCSVNCLLVCSGDQQKFDFSTEVIFLQRQNGAVASKFEDTLGVVL